MSRVKIKKQIKKKKRQLKIILLFIFIFLIIGIISVDYALREILALDGARVLGYEIEEKYISIDFMGKSNYIDRYKIDNTYDFIQNEYYKIIKKLNTIFKNIKMSVKSDIFLK